MKFVIMTLLTLGLTGTAAAQTFNVSNTSTTNYIINTQNDPTLRLVRGNTYTFNVSTPGHPFYVKTIAGSGTGNAYNNGVTNNGTDSGTITFTVPSNAPSTLFYNCAIHAAMSGTIQVVDVLPASQLAGLVLMGLLALGLGIVVLRRRNASLALV